VGGLRAGANAAENLPEIEPRFLGCQARSIMNILNELASHRQQHDLISLLYLSQNKKYVLRIDFKQPVNLCDILNSIKIGSQLKSFCVTGNEMPCLITTDVFNDHNIVARTVTNITRGFGLTTGFIGLQSVTHIQPNLLQLQLTLTTESLQGPGPPADPTGTHWPSTNSSGLDGTLT
jgi:hypothetical protein